MSLPISANTTCDIYRAGVVPPLDPAVAAVPCFLKSDWRGGQEGGDHGIAALSWTHLMLVDATVDIRDMYTGSGGQTIQDAVYVPDQNGTKFNVVFIELIQRGTPHQHKRVYLDRQAPTWPTDEL